MTLEDIHYLTEGGYKYDRGTNPAQSDGGAYKIPLLLLRVVTKSILLVFCRDYLLFLNCHNMAYFPYIYAISFLS